MVTPVSQPDNYEVARKFLDAAVLRQQAIAANIANSETPGYRRVDLAPDFETQLSARIRAGDSASSLAGVQPRLAVDTMARTTRPDGNTVELEHELVAMNRNAVQYEFLTNIVSNHLKELKLAITGHSV
ncbi:MAG TPA: flagellar basal body rod protein FlgB [Opitutus sp.]|nr:flagellar basal body rod protein FlgB [Opitutus sp.]